LGVSGVWGCLAGFWGLGLWVIAVGWRRGVLSKLEIDLEKMVLYNTEFFVQSNSGVALLVSVYNPRHRGTASGKEFPLWFPGEAIPKTIQNFLHNWI
jgi:hypothetical protein